MKFGVAMNRQEISVVDDVLGTNLGVRTHGPAKTVVGGPPVSDIYINLGVYPNARVVVKDHPLGSIIIESTAISVNGEVVANL